MQETVADIHKQLAMARLPSLPQALLRILELSDRDDVGLGEIAGVIAQDAALAAKVLGAANSAYYSRGRHVASLDQCLSIMGAAQVRRIALNQSVAELFGRFKAASAFDMRHYWFHALCVALTSRDLARHLGHDNTDEAYLAGLLHDVGQLALLTVATDRYLPLFKDAGGELALTRREQSDYGTTHAEVGAWLAQKWNLHGFFADALRYHHEPLARMRDAHVLAQVVNLANLLHCEDEREAQPGAADLDFWRLDQAQAQALRDAARAEAEQVAAGLGIEVAAHRGQPRFVPANAQETHGALADAVSLRIEAQSTLPEQLSGPDRDALHQGILRSARMLFSSRSVSLFVADAGILRGRPTADDDPRLGEIQIHLPAPDSAIARAYQGEIAVAGEASADGNLADAQVLRILAEERLLCLPLAHDGAALGVLVVGMDAASAQLSLKRTALLSTFCREGGRRLAYALGRQAEVEGALAESREQFQLHARKVVHEANNPLSVVRNYIALLREQLTDKQQAQEDFDLVESELRRVARILQQFRLPEGGKAKAQESIVDLNRLIDEVVRFCRLGRPELAKVATRLQLDEALPAVRVDGDKVRQVLTNLLFNAAEAMPTGGEVAIATASWQSAKGQGSVEITVSDNGPGLPAAVLEHLYQPKQSQKGGAHQGLGLSIVGKLVEEMGGILQCRSSQDGTSFKILLPASDRGQNG